MERKPYHTDPDGSQMAAMVLFVVIGGLAAIGGAIQEWGRYFGWWEL